MPQWSTYSLVLVELPVKTFQSCNPVGVMESLREVAGGKGPLSDTV